MPQGDEKTPLEKLEFKTMLPNINLLYLSLRVLIIMDSSYFSRFWCTFEGWLSMQQVTGEGLRPAPPDERRCTIACIHNADENDKKKLEDTWATKTPEEAHAVLSKPDIHVTNQSDKEAQLPKLLKLSALARQQHEALPDVGIQVGDLHIDLPPGAILKAGWLKKKQPKFPYQRQPRWFVLTASALTYFKKEQGEQLRGEILLTSIDECGLPRGGSRGPGPAMTIRVEGREYHLEGTWEELSEWQRTIMAAREQALGAAREQPLSHRLSAAAPSGAAAMPPSFESLEVTTWTVDKQHFAELYERTIFSLDKLTRHQQERLAEVLKSFDVVGGSAQDDGKQVGAHIKASAGAGKTFVALHLMIQHLTMRKPVLFVAPAEPLALFVSKWIFMRLQKTLGVSEATERLAHLFALFEADDAAHSVVPMVASLKEQSIRFDSAALPEARQVLAVVDEAHHVFSNSNMAPNVEAHVRHAGALVLLSDVSQSSGLAVQYPALQPVHLTEVVRCSERILTAAAPFQLGTHEQVRGTLSLHKVKGKPLRTFLFDVGKGEDRYEVYAQQTAAAVQSLCNEFVGLSLHDRVGIIVPNADFRAGIAEPLGRKLAARFELVDASWASAYCGRPGASDGKEKLVLDTSRHFDGLERLFVLVVGLDGAMPEEGAASSSISCSESLEARSRLYRGLMRAQMACYVVNELNPHGWLAFLTKVRLDKSKEFEREEQLGRQKEAEAQKLVDRLAALIDKAIEETPMQVALTEAELAPLRKEVLASEAEDEAAIRALVERKAVPLQVRALLTRGDDLSAVEQNGLQQRVESSVGDSAAANLAEEVNKASAEWSAEKEHVREALREGLQERQLPCAAVDVQKVEAQAFAHVLKSRDVGKALAPALEAARRDALKKQIDAQLQSAMVDAGPLPKAIQKDIQDKALAILLAADDAVAVSRLVAEWRERLATARVQLEAEVQLCDVSFSFDRNALVALEARVAEQLPHVDSLEAVKSVMCEELAERRKLAVRSALEAATLEAKMELTAAEQAKVEEEAFEGAESSGVDAAVRDALASWQAEKAKVLEMCRDALASMTGDAAGDTEAISHSLEALAVEKVLQGVDANDAIAQALRSIHERDVVEQTVWDTSANATASLAAKGAFDPFRSEWLDDLTNINDVDLANINDPIAVLSELDEHLIAKLSAGDIRLVRSAWLLQPSVTKMRKRQELEAIEEQGTIDDVSPLLACDEAAALIRRGTRSAAVLSLGWLLGGDPDPKAEYLTLVKQALAESPHVEGLYWE